MQIPRDQSDRFCASLEGNNAVASRPLGTLRDVSIAARALLVTILLVHPNMMHAHTQSPAPEQRPDHPVFPLTRRRDEQDVLSTDGWNSTTDTGLPYAGTREECMEVKIIAADVKGVLQSIAKKCEGLKMNVQCLGQGGSYRKHKRVRQEEPRKRGGRGTPHNNRSPFDPRPKREI